MSALSNTAARLAARTLLVAFSICAAGNEATGGETEGVWGGTTGGFGVFHANLWASGLVPFRIDTDSVPSSVDRGAWDRAIRGGIAQWNRDTRIVLVERTTEPRWVTFTYWEESGGQSCIGVQTNSWLFLERTGAQLIHIGADAGEDVVAHEIGHAVGLLHEHVRTDRDEHVWVFEGNVRNRCTKTDFITLIASRGISLLFTNPLECKSHNFWRCDTFMDGCTDLGDYDHDSVMRYESRTFSKGFATVLRKDEWSLSLNGGNFKPCRSTGGPEIELLGDTLVGDFGGPVSSSGFGVDDLLFHDGFNFKVAYTDPTSPDDQCADVQTLNAADLSNVSVADVALGHFDDDDRPDIFIADGSEWRVMMSTGGYAPVAFSEVFPGSQRHHTPMKNLLLGQFNDDGVSDVVEPRGSDIRVSYSGTDAWATLNEDFGAAGGFKQRVLVGDLTGDSRDDIVAWRTTLLVDGVVISDGGSTDWSELVPDWPGELLQLETYEDRGVWRLLQGKAASHRSRLQEDGVVGYDDGVESVAYIHANLGPAPLSVGRFRWRRFCQ